MLITGLEIRCCSHKGGAIAASFMRDGIAREEIEFVVYTLSTESGHRASMFGFAGRSALGAGHFAAASLRPFIMGRNALDREQIWHDWRVADRWWHHLPVFSFGPPGLLLVALGGPGGKPAPLALYRRGARQN